MHQHLILKTKKNIYQLKNKLLKFYIEAKDYVNFLVIRSVVQYIFLKAFIKQWLKLAGKFIKNNILFFERIIILIHCTAII